MFRKTLLVLALICSVVLAQSADVQKMSDEKLRSKLETIIIPKVKFENSNIQTILDYLTKQGEMLDPEKTGIPLILKPDTKDIKWSIAVNLSNISFGKALDQVCKQMAWQWTVENGAVVISRKKMYLIDTVLYEGTAANDYGKKLLDLIYLLPKISDLKKAAGKDEVIVAAPRLIVTVGDDACVSMVTDIPYFEKNKNGTFSLKKTCTEIDYNSRGVKVRNLSADRELSPGIRTLFTVNDTEKPDFVTVDYLICIAVMQSRKKIEGTELKAGKPVMDVSQINGKLTLELGKWSFGDKQVTFAHTGEKPIKTSMLIKVCLY